MKIVTKEFWITDEGIESLKDDTWSVMEKQGRYINKISVTYTTPDKRIEISESEFDSIYFNTFGNNTSFVYVSLKQILFGEKKDE